MYYILLSWLFFICLAHLYNIAKKDFPRIVTVSAGAEVFGFASTVIVIILVVLVSN